MNCFTHKTIIVFVVFSYLSSISSTEFSPNNSARSQRRLSSASQNGTSKYRDSQLLSLLAARRRQILQSRLQNHFATIAEIVETTTQLNHLLGISGPGRNISRIYIDIRNIRGSKSRRPTIPPLQPETEHNDLAGNNYSSGYLSRTDYQTANLSQSVQNSSKLFLTNEFNIYNVTPKARVNPSNFRLDISHNLYPNSSENFSEDFNGGAEKRMARERVIPDFQMIKKRLPIDLEQISYDTLGLAENKRMVRVSDEDEPLDEMDDSLQVEESNHGLYLINFQTKNKSLSEEIREADSPTQTNQTEVSKSNITESTSIPMIDNEDLKINLSKSKEKIVNAKEKPSNVNNTLYMSDSLYNHFRPLDTNLPEEEIQPFLYFGQRLSSTIKPLSSAAARGSYKVQAMQRHKSRFHPNAESNSYHKRNTDHSESNLMDLSVERQNSIANKVLNIRPLVPSRHVESVRDYFRPRNDTSSSNLVAKKREELKANSTSSIVSSTSSSTLSSSTTTSTTTTPTPITTSTPNSILLSSSSPIYVTTSETSETSTKNPRQRQFYIRNPQNRTYFIIHKRNNRPNLTRISTASDLLLATSKTIPPLIIQPEKLNFTHLISTTPGSVNVTSTMATLENNGTTVATSAVTTEVFSTKIVTSVSVNKPNKTKEVDEVANKELASTTTPTSTSKFQIVVTEEESQNSSTNSRENGTTKATISSIETTEAYLTSTTPIITSSVTSINEPVTVKLIPKTKPDYTLNIKRNFTLLRTSASSSSRPETTTKVPDLKSSTEEIFTTKVEIVTLKTSTSTTSSTTMLPIETTRKIETTSRPSVSIPRISNISINLYTRIAEMTTRASINPTTTPQFKIRSDTTETIILRQNNSQYEDNNLAAYILAGLGILPCIVIIGIFIKNLLKRRSKLLDGEADILSESSVMPEKEKEKHFNTINPVARLPMIITDTNSRWEFPRNKLRLKTLLGEGNFGQVWKAEADDLKGHDGLTRLVAVKTIKDGAGTKEREDLHRELSIMQKIGSHPHVVQLLGCCTEKEPYLLIMEYVMYGKLLTYLRDHRTRRDYYNFSDDAATLTSRDLTVFAYCVARGMEYLSSKGIIHRDLAARNILVDHNKLCKISDFGLSRHTHTGEVKEPRQPKNALPVRWMAAEALMYSIFTEKSDVWSFGILLWEIVTLGATPYATMSGREVMHCVCEGYRLERPGHCKPEIYRVMARTWASDPNQRPTFAELRNELAELLENNSIDYSYVDLESFAADSTIYEITNVNSRGNYCTIQSRISEFECDI